MAVALDNVVVLDLTTRFWASIAAATLGDFGADVVRLDRPKPDDSPNDAPADRTVSLPASSATASAPRSGPGATVWNYEFDLANRNKRSLGVDLGTPEGREIVGRLARHADVIVTDRAENELRELGVDYESVAADKPEIVYACGTGFGPKGPDSELPAIDELAAARTGMMPILPQPDQPPLYAGHGQMYTSVMIAFGVAVALFHRRRTGEGQRIDTSLLAGNMYGASLDLQAYLAIGGERMLHPVARMDAGNPMSGVLYPTSDGLWITLTMPDTDRWWPALAAIVELDENDPRFDSHDKRCGEHRLELIEVLDEAFRKQPASHWRTVFTEGQMSADVIEDYSYPAGDESAVANRYILDLEDPSLGALRMLGFPLFMTDTPARLRKNAPRAGQHSAEILHELLGYGEAEIAGLQRQGVVT